MLVTQLFLLLDYRRCGHESPASSDSPAVSPAVFWPIPPLELDVFDLDVEAFDLDMGSFDLDLVPWSSGTFSTGFPFQIARRAGSHPPLEFFLASFSTFLACFALRFFCLASSSRLLRSLSCFPLGRGPIPPAKNQILLGTNSSSAKGLIFLGPPPRR